MSSTTFHSNRRFNIADSDVVQVTDHALQRFWLRIDPIPSRDEVEARIKAELKRGFFLRQFRLDEKGTPVLYCKCSGMKVVIAPQANCWSVITLMEGKGNGSRTTRGYQAGF